MKEKIKNFFKKYPKIYALLSNFYYKVKYLELRFWGTKLEENKWAKRDIKTVLKSWENLNHPHRPFLMEEIKKIPHLSSILEIGCSYGPNLYHLAKIFPLAQIKGIDINPLSIKLGNKWLKEEKINNVELFVGAADQLNQFPDKNFDITFTDAVFLYIGPDKTKKVISEMQRITKKAIILVEHHSEKANALGNYNQGRWLRNYRKLFQSINPKSKIEVKKIPENLWGGDWGKYGYIIEIDLRK